MSRAKRQANVELLRILAMFMVVIMHYLYLSGALPENGRGMDGICVSAILLESLCIVAVNVYVLISGYFLSEASFSFRRVILVVVQTLFYTVLIPPVLTALGALDAAEAFNVYHIWNSIFPVQSGHYWFVTAYVVMCLFSPLLNAALDKLGQKQLRQVIFALLLLFSIGKTISPIQFAFDRYGYDFGWFLVLYLIGGYIRRFGIGFFQNAKRGFAVWISCAALTAAMEVVLVCLSEKITALGYYASVPFHYNFLPCLAGAVGLFYAFLHVKIKEGRFTSLIRWVSPAVFGVYLIHGQEDIAERWLFWVNRLFGKIGLSQEGVFAATGTEGQYPAAFADGPVWRYLAVLILQVLFVFAVCVLIDKARGALFSWIEGVIARYRSGRSERFKKEARHEKKG